MMIKDQSSRRQTLEQIATEAYAAIAAAFPVCAASDEFYFFPQVVSDEKNWRAWDDFSRARIEAFADRLRGWEASVGALADSSDGAEVIDADLLFETLTTLREQLIEITPHCSQPTFHLTIVAAGLSEALDEDCSAAWAARIAGLPEFLQRAADCLECVPRLFLEQGRAMAQNLLLWSQQLQASGFSVGAVPEALEQFLGALDDVPISESFLLAEAQFELLLRNHLCCEVEIDEIRHTLESELAEMDDLLCREAAQLVPGKRWQELETHVPFVFAPAGDLLNLYSPELEKLAAHIFQAQLVPPELQVSLSPELKDVPENMAVVRASDAYAARPGYPPRGGTFYVYSRGEVRDGKSGRTLEYRMTASHEAWPGHHLLDVCRWSLPQVIRRPVERPLCYEGWACLAEELMARTGYLAGEWDRFLLARRRIERAARGLIDLGLQSGRMSLSDAVQQLVDVGFPRQRAESVVPKYALRPGYQVCYSLGLRKNLALLERYGSTDPAAFARTLLRQGQIGFVALEKVLAEEGVD